MLSHYPTLLPQLAISKSQPRTMTIAKLLSITLPFWIILLHLPQPLEHMLLVQTVPSYLKPLQHIRAIISFGNPSAHLQIPPLLKETK